MAKSIGSIAQFGSSELRQIIKIEATKRGSSLNEEFTRASSRLAQAMVGTSKASPKSTITNQLHTELRSSIMGGLRTVSSMLKSGLDGSHGFRPLSEAYKKRKVPANRDLFWKNTGNLGSEFDRVLYFYEQALDNSGFLVYVRSRKMEIGKPFKFEVAYDLPEIGGESFFNTITSMSFAKMTSFTLDASPVVDVEPSFEEAFVKIGYLEGEGRTHRPFISKLMAVKGRVFYESVPDIIKIAAGSSSIHLNINTRTTR